ncbi:MAG: extracellular solute-binding protein [Planctomycetota bacterium]
MATVRFPTCHLFVTLMCLAGIAPAEETVRIYVSLDREHSERILDRFERKTGIGVDATYDIEASKTVGLVQRLIEEHRRGEPVADVYWNNELAQTIKLKGLGVLAPYVSPSARDIPAGLKDAEGYWAGFAARARILIVNTDLVPRQKFPKSMWDLTRPEWKGRVCMARPFTGTTATHAAALYVRDVDEAERYFDALFQNEVVWLSGNAHDMREVSAGRYAFGWTDTDVFHVARLKGAPVAAVYPDSGPDGIGTMLIPNSLMLIRGGPNPDAGKKLIDWLLRPEVERMLAESATAQIPVRSDIPVPPHVKRPREIGKIMEVDFEAVGRDVDRWVAHLRRRFAGAGEAEPVLLWVLAGVAALGLAGFVVLRRATREPA